ncbi:short transient receptor potential channel 5-like isoform X2 [Orbicella faveolata]|uniref:short transient receptor potential channel 5-like isoform X2 n=1 Tax=Orbicella faveolata TaxID=48498 RepID=UPI0009E49D9B|nr:short transient receptor potential channel 5-like isoform X2 [Orbicella faveolata]
MNKVRKVRDFTRAATFLDFRTYKKSRSKVKETGGGEIEEVELVTHDQDASEGEKALQKLIKSGKSPAGEQWNVDNIKNIVTAKNLCSCRDPITTAFDVNLTLQTLADTYTENTEFLNKLADQTEDFAVQLIDQVTASEQLVISDVPENADRCGSMLSDITDDAIVHSQKKFVSHPLLYKRFKMRWNLGLPKDLKPHGKFRALLYLLILIDTILTPLLMPIIGYAFHKDQNKRRQRSNTKIQDQTQTLVTEEKQPRLDCYLDYLTTPFVIFVKDKLSQVVFIAIHIRVCIMASSVEPTIEEYLIFVFFCGLVLSEYQQYKGSPLKYFKDMWNYVDVLTLFVYIGIIFLRIVTIVRGGDPYHNSLLEVTNRLYGVNTLLLVMRLSSLLAVSAVVGPLQLALFRMFVDLLIILLQFGFVIAAFSLAITKIYTAEMSYLTPTHNQTEYQAEYHSYCEHGALECLFKTSGSLIWSVFGLTGLGDMRSHTSSATKVVLTLFLAFLILSVIMLVNMLVALLSNTYDNVKTNAEVEWKFARAVVENQYRNLHCIVVPFNLLSVPVTLCYFNAMGNPREEDAENRRNQYKNFYRDRLFPLLTERYLTKYGGSFPLSVEEKIDLIMDKLKISHCDESVAAMQDEYKQEGFEDPTDDPPAVVFHLPGNSNIKSADAKFSLQISSSV